MGNIRLLKKSLLRIEKIIKNSKKIKKSILKDIEQQEYTNHMKRLKYLENKKKKIKTLNTEKGPDDGGSSPGQSDTDLAVCTSPNQFI